jgi:hypothetical protein
MGFNNELFKTAGRPIFSQMVRLVDPARSAEPAERE